MLRPDFIDYDPKYDILTVGFGDRSDSFGDEADSDFTVMRDSATNGIVGLVVWGFGEKYRSDTLPKWPEGIDIDTESDIVSQINLPLNA
ncbi:MAG: hypothetical protein LBL73_02390 [Synergistaceae bacterium]|jgi:hypothetical protein|nr:hypothetical protein [Synergistaceae bacterium]